jgi:hypothetical protein
MVYRIVALGIAILFLSGCVVGRKDFREAQAVLDYHGQPLALGVQDLRSYVISGDKGEDFAGLARSGYGIPYDIGTESNRPLAQEMADVIAGALRTAAKTRGRGVRSPRGSSGTKRPSIPLGMRRCVHTQG